MQTESKSKKFYVTIQGLMGSTELPMWADSLEQAEELAELEYADAGFTVTRIRPEVKHA